jgi:Amt family ammonium transporter
LITGAFAERISFKGLFTFGFVYIIYLYSFAHMTWHPDGLFSKWEHLTLLESTVVHESGMGSTYRKNYFSLEKESSKG